MIGTVEKITNRQVNTRNGPAESWSLNIDGDWYSNGFNKPPVQEGQQVEFTFSQNGQYKNIDKGSLKASTNAPAQPTTSAPSTPNTRDISIGYQSSRKDAIAVVAAMIAAGTAPVPAEKKKGYAATLALVDELTNTFYSDLQQVIESGGIQDTQTAPDPEQF